MNKILSYGQNCPSTFFPLCVIDVWTPLVISFLPSPSSPATDSSTRWRCLLVVLPQVRRRAAAASQARGRAVPPPLASSRGRGGCRGGLLRCQGLGRLRRRMQLLLLLLLFRQRLVAALVLKRWRGRERQPRGGGRSAVQESMLLRRLRRWRRQWGGVGGEEGAEAELQEGREAGVAGVNDLADVVDKLRDGDRGAAAAPDDVADDAVHPRGGGRGRRLAARLGLMSMGRRVWGRGRGHVHLRRVVLERGGQLVELGGQRGQLRAGGGGTTTTGGGGGSRDVGEVARDVAARRREVHVGRGALADHDGGGFLAV